MDVSLERVENEATLTITAPASAVADGYRRAVAKIADSAKIPGFRKGKAPRNIIEMRFGKAALKQEAFEIVINKLYGQALEQEKLVPVDEPRLESSVFEEGQDCRLVVKVTVKPQPVLGQYKGLQVEKKEVTITDEQVEAQVEELRQRHAKMEVAEEGHVIAKGDFAIIDFAGTIDGEAFSGGEGKGYPLEVGSNSFIPGFEDQLVGCSKGDAVDVDVTFPEDYHVKDLAGKHAVFKVNIQDVKRRVLPELTDEYVAANSPAKTVEELRASYKERLQQAADAESKAAYENALISLAVKNATFTVPPVMIEQRMDQMVEELRLSLENRKLSMAMYKQYTGLDDAAIRENQRAGAEENVKVDLVLDAIAEAEKIQVDMADVDAEVGAISSQHGADMNQVKKIIRDNGTFGLLLANIRRRKAARVVIDSAQ